MAVVAPGRLGLFSDSELADARRRGHIGFLGRLGIGPATNGRFNDINDKALRRRVADNFYTMADAEFDEAWSKGHIKFLGDAWGAQPDRFRRLRTQRYKAGPGWKSRKTTGNSSPRSAVNASAALDLAGHVAAIRKLAGQHGDKLSLLARLNELLTRPERLAGVFLPRGYPAQFDFMLIGEMPSMNEPFDANGDVNYNFDVTKQDKFLQSMMIKYELGGSYVTDIVKDRDVPRQPTPAEVETWLPFLLAEIEILGPKVLIVLGERTHRASFKPWVKRHVPGDIAVDWVYHYSRNPRDMFERRFAEVIGKYRRALPAHR